MKSRFIITNRQIINEVILPEDAQTPPLPGSTQEKIRRDGKDEARLHTRYGQIDPTINMADFNGDPNDVISLYPHRENDDADFNESADARFGSRALFVALQQAMSTESGGDVLLYVHGFNCDLDKAVRNLGLIEDKYVREGSPIKHLVLFTWPARNKKIRYRSDRRDTDESGEALARTILKLQKFLDSYSAQTGNTPSKGKIHLMAHSMGGEVLRYTMSSLRANLYNITLSDTIFDEAVLSAADVDHNLFERDKELAFLCSISKRVHTYNHKKDFALAISQTVLNSLPRMGRKGVESLDNLPTNLVMVDATDVKEETNAIDDNINHWYYYTSPEVVRDIIEVFKGTPALDIAKAPTTGSKRHKWPEKNANLYYIGETTQA